MDLRTGKTYDSKAEALADGVPERDLARVEHGDDKVIVKFSKGSFKSYRYDDAGQLVRVP